MAEEIVCPVCEAVNEASNTTCLECGADLSSQIPAEHDDPSMADTPAGDEQFFAEEGDFEDPEAYAEQDVHEDPGDVAIEDSPSEQIITEENPEDEFAEFEDSGGDLGDEADVDEGEFPIDDFDDDEFGDEDDLYDDEIDEEMPATGVAEGESPGDELAQEAAADFDVDPYDEFADDDDEFGDEDEFGDGFSDEDDVEEGFADDEFADDDQFEDEFAGDAELDDDFDAFEAEQGDDFDEDLVELAEDASDEVDDDEFAEFEEEAGFEEGLQEPSEQEPPELAVILNPQREGAEDLADLPTPGPYAEPATLTLFADRQHLGDLAVSANVLTLGLPDAYGEDTDEELDEIADEPMDEGDSFDDPGTVELEDELIEEVEDEPLDDEDLYDEDIQLQGGGEPAGFEAEAPEDVDDEFAEFEDESPEEQAEAQFDTEEDIDAEDLAAADEDAGEPVLVDLSQYANADAFADLHSYIFRQNKNYTLYVTSDAGTQLNDELLDLGEHRTLEDGDVIVLGGTLAMRFNMPA
jgi:hypothetical protein